jgi:hypothetical protein
MTKKQNFFLLSFVCVIVFFSTVVTENLAFASSVGKNDPTALTLSVNNESKIDVKSSHFIVRVWPNDEIVSGIKVGEEVPLLTLPKEAVHFKNGQVEIKVNPDTLSDKYINKDGRVSIEVHVLQPSTNDIATTSATVRLYKNTTDSKSYWIDPLIDAEAKNLLSAESISTPMNLNIEFFKSPADLTEVINSDCGSLRTDLEKTANWWSTIGDTFPVGGKTAKMTYQGSHDTTYGSAVSVSGGWKAQGSKSIGSAFGVEYVNSSSNMTYRVQTKYGYYRTYYTRGCGTLSIKWEVMNETGGSDRVAASTPNFTNCSPVSGVSTWYRESSSGNSTSYSTGVKAAGTINIDLSLSTNYGSKRKLIYNLDGASRRMCGSNNSPALASRVQSKLP